MRRRLVQEEDVRLQKERAREEDAHPPAAAQRGRRPAEHGVGEAEHLAEQRARAVRGGVGVAHGQLRKDLSEARGVGPVGALEEAGLLAAERGELGVGGDEPVDGRAVGRRGGGVVLLDVDDAQVGGEPGELPPRDRAQQRGLADAVDADKPVAVALHELERGALEEVPPGEAEVHDAVQQHVNAGPGQRRAVEGG